MVLRRMAACLPVRSSCDSIVILVLPAKLGHRGRSRDGEGLEPGWVNTFPPGEYRKLLTLAKDFVMSCFGFVFFFPIFYLIILQYLKHREKERERM